MKAVIGILGGMGPMATVDFVEKIIQQTPAKNDQEHLPLIIHSVPQIPDRTACLMDQRESPLPGMVRGVNTLLGAGVSAIAIPCNTAHYWYDALTRVSAVPIFHIAQACAQKIVDEGGGTVGLMATDGTLKAGFYPKELARSGIKLILPESGLQRQVMSGIYHVKSGDIGTGGKILERCIEQILELGVEKVILGCTEIPLALERIESPLIDRGIDATSALAAACVRWHGDFEQRNVA